MNEAKLFKLRKEIILGSIFTNDYQNSFGIDEERLQVFFDSYMEELGYILEEKLGKEEIEKMSCDKYYTELFKLDNKENLYNYYCSCEDLGF